MITLPFTDVDTTPHAGQPGPDVPAAVSTCTTRAPYSSRSTCCTLTPGSPNNTDVSSTKSVASLVQLRRNSQTSRGHGRPTSGALADPGIRHLPGQDRRATLRLCEATLIALACR